MIYNCEVRRAVVVMLSACGFSSNLPAQPPEAGTDASGPCTTWTFKPADFDPCAIATPEAPPVLGAGMYTIDSDTGMLTGNVTAQLPYTVIGGIGVVSLSELTVPVNVTLRAEGMRPLVIASWSTLTIHGTVAASSRGGGMSGAGANSQACDTSAGGTGKVSGDGDGGGGGGGFGDAGGLGGNGDSVADSGGTAGVMRGLPQLLDGGCRGGDAGPGGDGTRGIGGASGGAIALVAKDKLTVDGVVHAGGAGGTGGMQGQTGGGGGGSGGMIRLEAADVELAMSGTIAANGGQGGGGCDNGTADAGADGLAEAAVADTGDNSEGGGTKGGVGGWKTATTGGSAPASGKGGGGGGGGTGYIVVKGHTSATGIMEITSSPTAIVF